MGAFETGAPSAKRPAAASPSPEALTTRAGAPPAPGSIAASLPLRIGVVTHYYSRPHAAVLRLEAAELCSGDTIHVRGHTTDFYQRVEHLEHNHAPVERAVPGDDVAIQVSQRVREGDEVFRLTAAVERP